MQSLTVDSNAGQYESMRSQLARKYSIPFNKPQTYKQTDDTLQIDSGLSVPTQGVKSYRGEVEERRKMLEIEVANKPLALNSQS